MNQRWLLGRASYRPPEEPIRTADYHVAVIDSDTEARNFLRTHHYSRTYPAARRRFGLYRRRGTLQGVAVFSHPVNDATLTNVFPVAALDCLELGRFALRDAVPGNGETWFLGRCFAALKAEGFYGVVAFSDPVPRVTVAGVVVMPGHWGTIYQSHNGVFMGRSKPRTERHLPDGTLYSDRAIAKVIRGDRGRAYAVNLLIAAGADPPGDADVEAWFRHWLPLVCRPVRHGGKLKYAWGLHAEAKDVLPESKPYPKRDQN